MSISPLPRRGARLTRRWRNLHYCDKKQALFALADLMERDAETLAVLVWINGWEAGDITMPFGGFK